MDRPENDSSILEDLVDIYLKPDPAQRLEALEFTRECVRRIRESKPPKLSAEVRTETASLRKELKKFRKALSAALESLQGLSDEAVETLYFEAERLDNFWAKNYGVDDQTIDFVVLGDLLDISARAIENLPDGADPHVEWDKRVCAHACIVLFDFFRPGAVRQSNQDLEGFAVGLYAYAVGDDGTDMERALTTLLKLWKPIRT